VVAVTRTGGKTISFNALVEGKTNPLSLTFDENNSIVTYEPTPPRATFVSGCAFHFRKAAVDSTSSRAFGKEVGCVLLAGSEEEWPLVTTSSLRF